MKSSWISVKMLRRPYQGMEAYTPEPVEPESQQSNDEPETPPADEPKEPQESSKIREIYSVMGDLGKPADTTANTDVMFAEQHKRIRELAKENPFYKRLSPEERKKQEEENLKNDSGEYTGGLPR